MSVLEYQVRIIGTIIQQKHKDIKIFRCPDSLFEHLVSLDNIAEYPLLIRTKPEEFKDYVNLDDPNLYLVDSRKSQNIGSLITEAKRWYFYGHETTAYMAFVDKHFLEGYFGDNLKIEGIALDMSNIGWLNLIFPDVRM
jgi:hypothetical protein